ncbi:AbrB/MazE/SpoVT family DNA-binding domain-containing protein [Sphingomonas sp. PB4P5]|uniref:AbrB/MazE/SpoVT family DNA-binding domain-containing protein n=1 Tax=Parasphingomonas puruogangriensis TaxID=3096155 RepID=UPI002FC6B025
MQTALRKMGNSTGMILPRAILGQIGVTTGAAMDLRVENGRLIATPVITATRAGWAASAATIATSDSPEEADWQGFANKDDQNLAW